MATINTPKITPFLWFETNGQEGAEYYTRIFPDSKIISKTPMITTFEICHQRFSILEAGPHDKFNDAISFFVHCDNQEEVDYYWNTFINDGGKESQCGWLQDKYGVRWQIVPEALMRLTSDPDPERAKRVVDAMLKMKKIIVDDLEKAFKS